MIENNIITNDYVIYNKSKIELISMDFPSEFKRRLYAIISNILLDAKKNQKKVKQMIISINPTSTL